MLCAWLYRSRATVPARSVADGLIYLRARETNAVLGVTGYLHREDGYYVQYVEGSDFALDWLEAIIRRDPRHVELQTLVRGEIDARRFAGWDMAFTAPDGPPGRTSFAVWQGMRNRAERIATASAPQMLEFMASAVRTGAARSVANELPCRAEPCGRALAG